MIQERVYQVTVKNVETNLTWVMGTYATRFNANCAIEEAIDEDLECGEYEDYEYYVNNEKVA